MKFITTITIESIVDDNDSVALRPLKVLGEEETVKQLAQSIKEQVLENMNIEDGETVNVVVKLVKDEGLTKEKKEILKSVVGSASCEGLDLSDEDKDKLN